MNADDRNRTRKRPLFRNCLFMRFIRFPHI
nr:MAG TPA: hypothetical protein [Caudoviricetes sp.]